MSWNVKITVNFLYRAADYVSVTVLNTCCRQFEVNGPHVSLLTSVTSTAFSHSRIKRQRGGDLHKRNFFFLPHSFQPLAKYQWDHWAEILIQSEEFMTGWITVMFWTSWAMVCCFKVETPEPCSWAGGSILKSSNQKCFQVDLSWGIRVEGGDNWGQGSKSMKIRKQLPPCAHFRPHSRHSSDGSFYLFYFFIFRSSCISCGTTFMIRFITVEFKGH